MPLLKDTFLYLKKAFWILVIGAIVPSVIISFFSRAFSSITSLPLLFVGKTDYNFVEIMILIMTPIFDANFWVAFVGHIIYFLFMWIAMIINVSLIEMHLKTGMMSLKLGKHQILSYALPLLFTLLIWAALYLVGIVAQSGLISLIHYICGVTPPSVIDCILSVIVSGLILVGFIYCAIHLMYVPLIMVYYGYGFRESFVESFRITSNKIKTLFIGLAVPFSICILVDLILNFVTAFLFGRGLISAAAQYWIDFVISVASHSFMIIYLTAFGMVSFYKLADIDRRDIRTY